MREFYVVDGVQLDSYGLYFCRRKAELGWQVDPKQVDLCERYIREVCFITRSVNTGRSSYSWKHVVEEWCRYDLGNPEYISNGSFILAALKLGMSFRQDGPNAYFNLSPAVGNKWRNVAHGQVNQEYFRFVKTAIKKGIPTRYEEALKLGIVTPRKMEPISVEPIKLESLKEIVLH